MPKSSPLSPPLFYSTGGNIIKTLGDINSVQISVQKFLQIANFKEALVQGKILRHDLMDNKIVRGLPYLK
jgi:hypothetical protein